MLGNREKARSKRIEPFLFLQVKGKENKKARMSMYILLLVEECLDLFSFVLRTKLFLAVGHDKIILVAARCGE